MSNPISFHPSPAPHNARFSILIPTWNNLPFLRLCIRSIRRYSSFPHQIILHINDGSDGTLAYARQNNLSYSFSPANDGICRPLNAARALAKTSLLLYLNDDMVVCPGWDAALLNAALRLPPRRFLLSATMIEPFPTASTPVIAPHDFGLTPDSFDEPALLRSFASFQKADWAGATRPPTLVHRDLWDLVGGISVEFSPGLYSDPDFSMKLWQAGVRHFHGVAASRVYHFVSQSVGRVTPNPGRRQFLQKWRLSSSTFTRHYLHLGAPLPLDAPLPDPNPAQNLPLRRALFKNYLQLRLPH